MKTVNHNKGNNNLWGYSYVIDIPMIGKKPKQEKHQFWFDSPEKRDYAMQAVRNTIPSASQWRKIGK